MATRRRDPELKELICEWCGKQFTSVQPLARFCCRQHKKNGAAKRFRERNPGYYGKYSKLPRMIAYVEANKDRIREQARAYMQAKRAADPESMRTYNREWFRANSSKHVGYNRARRAAKLSGASVGVSEFEWEAIKRRQRNRCFYCTKVAELTQDHVVPLTRGGLHAPGNIVGACKSCNSSKSNAFVSEWKKRGGIVIGL